MVEQPELILWIKPIFVSNPTELGKVMLRLELSWGCDNYNFHFFLPKGIHQVSAMRKESDLPDVQI